MPIDALFWLGLLAGFLMMLHVTADVTGRYVFNRPLEGTTEIVAAYYMVMVAYLPWAWISRRDNHIVAGMFQHFGTPAFDFWLEIGVKIFTTFCVAVFTYQTFLAGAAPDAGRRGVARRHDVSCRSGRAAGCCRLAGGLMVLYLVLRVIARRQPPGCGARAPGCGAEAWTR